MSELLTSRQPRKSLATRILRKDAQNHRDLEKAAFRYLAFSTAHEDLARRIARQVAAFATNPRNRRTFSKARPVGFAWQLTLEHRAERAVRAHLRHVATSYDCEVDELYASRGAAPPSDEDHAYLKRRADIVIDAYLDDHRPVFVTRPGARIYHPLSCLIAGRIRANAIRFDGAGDARATGRHRCDCA